MRTMLVAALVQSFVAIPASAEAPTSSVAVDLVQKQDAAYNAHDLEAFLAFYAPNAELYEFPDKLLARGTAALRERYRARFAEPGLHVETTERMVVGGTVIAYERVRRVFPEGAGTWDVAAIYEVKDALITRVWFIFGAKTLDEP